MSHTFKNEYFHCLAKKNYDVNLYAKFYLMIRAVTLTILFILRLIFFTLDTIVFFFFFVRK